MDDIVYICFVQMRIIQNVITRHVCFPYSASLRIKNKDSKYINLVLQNVLWSLEYKYLMKFHGTLTYKNYFNCLSYRCRWKIMKTLQIADDICNLGYHFDTNGVF